MSEGIDSIMGGLPEGAYPSKKRLVDVCMWDFGHPKPACKSITRFRCKCCGEERDCANSRAVSHVLGGGNGWRRCKRPHPEVVAHLVAALTEKVNKPRKKSRKKDVQSEAELSLKQAIQESISLVSGGVTAEDVVVMKKPLKDLSVDEVGYLLDSHNMSIYKDEAQRKSVDGECLLMTHTVEELREFGVSMTAKARILFNAIAQYKVDGVPLHRISGTTLTTLPTDNANAAAILDVMDGTASSHNNSSSSSSSGGSSSSSQPAVVAGVTGIITDQLGFPKLEASAPVDSDSSEDEATH